MKLHTNQGDAILVSTEDFVYLSRFTWCQHPKGYFYGRTGEVRDKKLHRVVAGRMGLDLSRQIDHKNRDKSDNQRDNLREASHGQNRANSGLNGNNKSGFKGVHLKRRSRRTSSRRPRSDVLGDRWVAQINVNGKKIHLGYFNTPEEAHEAYKAAALEYFGEFANP